MSKTAKPPQTPEEWSALLRSKVVVRTVQAIVEAGQLLQQCKDALPHGQYLSALAAAGIDESLARRHRKIAANGAMAEPAIWPHLPPSYKALVELVGLNSSTLHRLVSAGELNPSLTVEAARMLARSAVHPSRPGRRRRSSASWAALNVRPDAIYHQDEWVTIIHGDCRDVLPDLKPESVQLVLADPPFAQEYAYLWSVIGEESARMLEPGCSLVTLLGHHQVLSAGNALSQHLRPWWHLVMDHGGSLNPLAGARVAVSHTPGLWFVKDNNRAPLDRHYPPDVVRTKRDKAHHEWGNPVEWFAHWVKWLSEPGETVLDPTMGAGTTLVAAKQQRRRSIGIEVDERHCETAARRLEETEVT